MKINKKIKKILKEIKKTLKKIKIYVIYIRFYPQAVFKFLFFLIIYGPKKTLNKLKKREKYLFYKITDPQFNLIFFIKKIIKNLTSLINIINYFNTKKNHFNIISALGNKYKTHDLSLYLKKRKPDVFDIFIFSIIAFDFRIQRPQHFAFELAKKGHRIFYIENEFLINKNTDNNGFAPYVIKKRAKNIYLLKLSSSKNYFIYNQAPSKKDLELMFASIKKLIYDAFVINPLAKIDHPFWGFLKEKLAMPVIYDCMDEHSGFKENSKKILEKETDLIKNSDIVLSSSNYLFKKLKKYQPKKLVLIPNAGDFEHFNKILSQKIKTPSDIKNIKKPIIGYYGSIDDWFDTDLLEKMLIRFNDCNIVLIGRISNHKIWLLKTRYKNLYLLGEKNYQELPFYLYNFDVCLIPFKINNLIKATHPVKVYEYLAQGKPVVSTSLPEIKHLKNLIYLSRNHHQFLKNIIRALREENSYNNLLSKKRVEFAQKQQWSEKFKLVEDNLNKYLYPKISIVILSYFNWQITKKCLDSIINYSFYPNYEIIIIDNKSDQQTKKYLKSLTDKRIKVILLKRNLGFGAGNNFGMKHISSNSEFIIVLNNDTIITPGWISRLVFYAKDKDIGLVGPVTNNIGNEAKINISYNKNNIFNIFINSKKYTSANFGKCLETNRIAAFCWIKRREVYEKIGGFDERFFPAFFEDDDYCLRIKNAYYKIIIAEDVFIHHYLGQSSEANKNLLQDKNFLENKKRFEEKWKIKWKPHRYRKSLK